MHWHPATRAYAPAHEEGGGWLGGCGTPPPPLPPPRPALRPAAAPPPRCKRPPQPARCARGRPAPGRGGGGACGARRLSLPRGRGGGGGVVVVAEGGGSGLPFLLRHARGDTAGGRRGGVCLKRPWLCGWRGGGWGGWVWRRRRWREPAGPWGVGWPTRREKRKKKRPRRAAGRAPARGATAETAARQARFAGAAQGRGLGAIHPRRRLLTRGMEEVQYAQPSRDGP